MVEDRDGSAYATPRSAERMLRILEALAASDDGRTLAALSKEIETPKSSVLNLMRALTQGGYVEHSEGYYRLGPSVFRLASAVLARRRFPEVALPILKRLADATGETAMISEMAQDGREFTYIAKAESRQSLRFAATVGDRRPLYSTAAGLVLLAHMPQAFVQKYLSDTKFEPLTPLTKVTRPAIEAALDDVRRRGYALTTGESTLGLTGIAAPITGSGGLLSAVVLGLPTERFKERSDEFVAATVKAAQDISAVMGQIGDTRSI